MAPNYGKVVTHNLPSSNGRGRAVQNTASLYIGDLAPAVTEAALFKLFNAVGPVASIRVCRDAVSKRSLGYGYVNFHNALDAERALDTLNFTTVSQVPIRIMWSERDPQRRKNGKGNVIVKKLDKSIDHKTLFDTFSIFGDILSCKVAFTDKGESLSYGFVHFASEEVANSVVLKVNDMEIAGQKVSVEKWQPLSERIKNYTNIYVKNVPGDFTSDQFQNLFEQYGPLEKLYDAAEAAFIMAKPRIPVIDTYWGFCNFLKHADAEKAVKSLSGEKIKGDKGEEKELFVTRALTRGEKRKRKKERFNELREKRRLNSKFVNVFVKNLSEKITDTRLEELFKEFGAITSVKVARDDNSHSKGFGFVCYKNPEEATRAITEMNTKIVEGKPLYVAPHQPRDERSQELHRRFSAQNRSYQQSPARYSSARRATYGTSTGYSYAASTQGGGYSTHTPAYLQQQYRPHTTYGQHAATYPQMIQPARGPNVMRSMSGYNQQQRAPPAAPRRPSYSSAYTAVHHSGRAPPPPQMPVSGRRNSSGPPSRSSSSASLNVHELKDLLNKSDPQQQKQMIGEKLFPMIQSREPKLAGKITGMLLEMDNTELLHLLDTPKSLHVKINEALHVLRRHQSEMATQGPGHPSMVNTPQRGLSTAAFTLRTPLGGMAGPDGASPE